MLLVLVEHGFILDLAALVAGFHGAQYAAAVGDGLEFTQHGLFDEIGQLIDDEAALQAVLILGEAEFAVDDQLDGHGTTHRLFGGRGDRLVKSVGVQRVAVVVDRDQCLQRGADVVELHLLRVQRTA